MRIEHQCPQCGAPVVLEETDRLLTCDFCKTRLFMQPRDYFRYCFSPSDPFLEEIIYVPYWRFRGMHFLSRTSGVKHGIIDKTFLAIDKKGLPPTLGIRPQSLKISFLRPGEKTRVLKPAVTFDRSSAETKKTVTVELVRVSETRYLRGSNGDYVEVPDVHLEVKEERIFDEAFVADTVSLIYAPLFLRNGRLYDAVTNEMVNSDAVDISADPESLAEDWQVNFLPTICPNCGWDTTAERDSSVVFCANCSSAWEARGDTLERVHFTGTVSQKVSEKPQSFVPFWRIETRIEGIDLNSYADLVRFANLPKAPQPEWETEPLRLWVPAFKTTPSLFLRLAKQFTIANTEVQPGALPPTPILPVNIPLRDAVDSIVTVIADLALRKKDIFPRLADLKVDIRESLLVLVPFTETNHEYLQPDINCGFMKNALKQGRNI